MIRTTRITATSKIKADSHEPGTIKCMLFADTVTEYLCSLRKKELNQNDAFSCSGCCTETIMDCVKAGKQQME